MGRKKDDYFCPRCGYSTKQKGHMRKHLYDIKKPCPCLLNPIDLTDEIREHVLANRIYRPPVKEAPITIINNYNQLFNIVSKMNVVDKLDCYNKFKKTDMLDLEESITSKYSGVITKLEDCSMNEYWMTTYDIFNTIDKATCVSDPQQLSVFYNNMTDKINIYQLDEWQEYHIDEGIKAIVTIFKECYFDLYEKFLVNKLETESKLTQKYQMAREHITEYYTFIAAFDLYPWIKDKDDCDIFDDPQKKGTYDIQDYWYAFYSRTKGIKGPHKEIRSKIASIIKTNSKTSIYELNKRVMEVITMDEEFKNNIVNNITNYCKY